MRVELPMTLSNIIKHIDAEAKANNLEENIVVTKDAEGKLLVIDVQMWGKSRLIFQYSRLEPGWTSLTLLSKDMAFLHRKYYDEAFSSLKKQVKKLGGKTKV